MSDRHPSPDCQALPPTLPHYLRPGLRLVFVGCNPSIYSATIGHYYGRPGNPFWKHLSQTSLVARTVTCNDDHLLMDEAGIGFTDLCPRPTVRASDLSAEERRTGAARLYREILDNQPRFACFSGRGVYRAFARYQLGQSTRQLDALADGPQPTPIGETVVWVVPNSSGLASRWHKQRIALLSRLAAQLDASPRA